MAGCRPAAGLSLESPRRTRRRTSRRRDAGRKQAHGGTRGLSRGPAPFPSRDFSKCSSGPQEPKNDWPCNSRAETGSTRRAVCPEPRGPRRGQRARRVPLQGGGSRVRICALPSSPTTAVCPFHNAEQCLATATQSGPRPGLPAARAPQSAGLSSAWKSFFEWQARPLSSGDPRAPRGAQPRAAAVLALWGGAGDVPGARRIK